MRWDRSHTHLPRRKSFGHPSRVQWQSGPAHGGKRMGLCCCNIACQKKTKSWHCVVDKAFHVCFLGQCSEIPVRHSSPNVKSLGRSCGFSELHRVQEPPGASCLPMSHQETQALRQVPRVSTGLTVAHCERWVPSRKYCLRASQKRGPDMEDEFVGTTV